MRISRVSTEYDRLAPSYESRWNHYVTSTIRHTVPHLGLRPDLKLLDIGCGTGALLHEVQTIEPSSDVCGVDIFSQRPKRLNGKPHQTEGKFTFPPAIHLKPSGRSQKK